MDSCGTRSKSVETAEEATRQQWREQAEMMMMMMTFTNCHYAAIAEYLDIIDLSKA